MWWLGIRLSFHASRHFKESNRHDSYSGGNNTRITFP
jgi:hypothetical protein